MKYYRSCYIELGTEFIEPDGEQILSKSFSAFLRVSMTESILAPRDNSKSHLLEHLSSEGTPIFSKQLDFGWLKIKVKTLKLFEGPFPKVVLVNLWRAQMSSSQNSCFWRIYGGVLREIEAIQFGWPFSEATAVHTTNSFPNQEKQVRGGAIEGYHSSLAMIFCGYWHPKQHKN